MTSTTTTVKTTERIPSSLRGEALVKYQKLLVARNAMKAAGKRCDMIEDMMRTLVAQSRTKGTDLKVSEKWGYDAEKSLTRPFYRVTKQTAHFCSEKHDNREYPNADRVGLEIQSRLRRPAKSVRRQRPAKPVLRK